MKKLCYGLAVVFLTVGAALMGYTALYFRFTHPALSETQLFLSNWEAIVIGVVLLIAGYILIGEAEKYED
jgi:hypothetical protein